jgi:hypothetical protein
VKGLLPLAAIGCNIVRMKLCPILGSVFALCAVGADAAEPAAPPKAAERCEAAVSDTITLMRGKQAREIQFTAAKRSLTPTGDTEFSVKGEGRYTGASGNAVPFSYSCAYDAKNGATSGAMFRELSVASAARPTVSSNQPWQPDLAKLSPESCESAVASALKDKHPQAGTIVFATETRRLQPAPEARIGLEGQGTVQHAPGLAASLFSYHCEFDPASGKLVRSQAKD